MAKATTLERMEFEDRIKAATNKIRDTVEGNKELYLAQIIKMNPYFNPLNYRLCTCNRDRQVIDDFGHVKVEYIVETWLEPI